VTAIAGSGFTFNLVGAAFGAALDPGLLGFYGLGGLPANQGNMNLSFFSASVPPSAFNSSFVASGNLTAKTPEPLSLALLGTVLLLCSGAAVRRMRKARK
jgi:hypothetical protein